MDLLLLTTDPNPESVLPSLALLAHTVSRAHGGVVAVEAGRPTSPSWTRAVIWPRRAGGAGCSAHRGLVPVVAVVNEGGLVAVNDWGIDEILLPGTGPAEIDARLRLSGRAARRCCRSGERRQSHPRRAGHRRGAPTPPGCEGAHWT